MLSGASVHTVRCIQLLSGKGLNLQGIACSGNIEILPDFTFLSALMHIYINALYIYYIIYIMHLYIYINFFFFAYHHFT